MAIEVSRIGSPGALPLGTGTATARAQAPRNRQDDSPAPQTLPLQTTPLQATSELGRLALAARHAGAPQQADLITRTAARAYDHAAQVLGPGQATAQGICERIALLPVPGDLSLEASRMPPLGDGPGLQGETGAPHLHAAVQHGAMTNL